MAEYIQPEITKTSEIQGEADPFVDNVALGSLGSVREVTRGGLDAGFRDQNGGYYWGDPEDLHNLGSLGSVRDETRGSSSSGTPDANSQYYWGGGVESEPDSDEASDGVEG